MGTQRGLLFVGVLVIGFFAAVGMGGGIVAAEDGHECSFPLEVTDVTGETVSITERPERIVTTSPSAAQTLWEFGAEDRVVGLTAYANYLDGATNRTVVTGEEGRLSTERVIGAEPDLVLAPNTTTEQTIGQLREAGVTVYHFPAATSMEDVKNHTYKIGQLTGECDAANETVDWMNERIRVAEQTVEGRERPEVLYLFFGFTAGSNTHIADIIDIAGGDNIAVNAGINGYKEISEEIVAEQDPDWIILNSNDPALPNSEVYNETTAVEENQTVVIPIEQLNQPAPWNVYAIDTLAQTFHPDAYKKANESVTSEEHTDDQAPGGTEDDGTADTIPGFGVTIAVLALALAAGARFFEG